MEKKEFLKVTRDIFKEHGFFLNNGKLMRDFGDFIIWIHLQKSMYCDGYYINYHIVPKELLTTEELNRPFFEFMVMHRIIFPSKFNKHYADKDFLSADKNRPIVPCDYDCFMFDRNDSDTLKKYLNELLPLTFEPFEKNGIYQLNNMLVTPLEEKFKDYLIKNGIKIH